MSSELLLVVCAANVCRSPLAEFILRADVQRSDIEVRSAGMHAREGDLLCPRVAMHRTNAEWAHLAAEHRAREATTELLLRATLVLAASREVRGEIVRLEPSVRDRVFTLREAAHRGGRFGAGTAETNAGLAEYANHLDRARTSMGAVPSTRHSWWPGGSADDAISIADRHSAGLRAHRRTLAEVEAAAGAIAVQLDRARLD